MYCRKLTLSLLLLTLQPACNELLDIHAPADQLLMPDGAVGSNTEGIRSNGDDEPADEDAGAE